VANRASRIRRERAKSSSCVARAPNLTMPPDELVLETRDLGYAYAPGRFAVRHLTLGLGRGEVLGLLGRNGAGKTTTVRLLTTLLPPTEGTATVLGQDIRTGGRALRSHLGVVLQSESLDFVTVEKNLTLYAFLWGVGRETAKARAEEMIELFELGAARHRKPWALSGGERRRFQVARELMHDMEILFLDEPTVGLDAIARRRILQYLKERARTGLSIVFTTHILHEADVLCDRIAVLHLGRLIALDTAEALKVKHGGAREVSVTFTAALPSTLREELTRALSAQDALVLEMEASPNAATRLVFRAKNAEELLPWFSHWAQDHGLGLGRLSIEEATLEGAFLGMVGLAEQDESAGATPSERGAEALPPGRTEGLT
jgi:ABC-2 type transport system ATP-binding protein